MYITVDYTTQNIAHLLYSVDDEHVALVVGLLLADVGAVLALERRAVLSLKAAFQATIFFSWYTLYLGFSILLPACVYPARSSSPP